MTLGPALGKEEMKLGTTLGNALVVDGRAEAVLGAAVGVDDGTDEVLGS